MEGNTSEGRGASLARRLAEARAMRATPTHKLGCPGCGAVVTLYAAGIVDGSCGKCRRSLRPLALDESIGADGKTVRDA